MNVALALVLAFFSVPEPTKAVRLGNDFYVTDGVRWRALTAAEVGRVVAGSVAVDNCDPPPRKAFPQ